MGSGSGGGGGDQTVTTLNQPWADQAPYLRRGFREAEGLMGMGGPKYYGGQNYINLSNMTQGGISDLYTRGARGSRVMDTAERMTRDTLGGKYLSPNSNPYLQATYDQALNAALPSLNATFSAAGRTGADAQQGALADTYGALGRDIYGQNYQQERQRQMQALIFAPQIAANDYQDINAQLQAGAMRDKQSQNILDANMERFNFNQNRPYNNLDWYMRNIGGQQYGSTNAQQQTGGSGNVMGNVLGGALTGGAIGAALPQIGSSLGVQMGAAGPWGWGAGALLGLLGS